MGNITEKCEGCEKIDTNDNCTVYPNPAAQMRWVEGGANVGCAFNMKKHVQTKSPDTKVRVGQQKQKKR